MENEHFFKKEKCVVYFDKSVSFICTYKHFSIFNAIMIILYTICLAKFVLYSLYRPGAKTGLYFVCQNISLFNKMIFSYRVVILMY